ncbi:unnamed protein product [Urochloa humidicola]
MEGVQSHLSGTCRPLPLPTQYSQGLVLPCPASRSLRRVAALLATAPLAAVPPCWLQEISHGPQKLILLSSRRRTRAISPHRHESRCAAALLGIEMSRRRPCRATASN